MSETINSELMTAAIRQAIDAEINRAVDEATEEVLTRTRDVVRKKIGQIACSLLNQYEIREDRQKLIITVSLRDDK